MIYCIAAGCSFIDCIAEGQIKEFVTLPFKLIFMQKILAIIPLILLPFFSIAGFDDDFINQTLRIDYIHSGFEKEEYFALDQLIKEPAWDRSTTQLIDEFNYGKYRCEALDSASGRLLFRFNYANLFNEWQTTEDAKVNYKAFHESVIMPFPKKTIKVIFYSRDKKNVWKTAWNFFVNPSSYNILPERKLVYPAKCIQNNGDPAKSLDITFLAEGYTYDEMSKFRKDAKRFADFLNECSPYKEFRDKINFWTVESPSEESGTDLPGLGKWKKTILNASFFTFGTERYLTTFDNKTMRDLAANTPYDFIIIIVNTEKYGGGGFYNTYALCAADNSLSNYVLVHEFGHCLGGLGDEYYTSEVAVQDFYPAGVEPWEANLTTLTDFDHKWKSMMDPGTPVPTPATDEYKGKVGVFEGGGYIEKGVYRPALECTMKNLKYNGFCPVCKKALFEVMEMYVK